MPVWAPEQRTATASEYDLYLQNLRLTAGQPIVRTLPETFVMAKMPTGYQGLPGYEAEYAIAQQQITKYTPPPPLPTQVEQKVSSGQTLTENDIVELLIVVILYALGVQFDFQQSVGAPTLGAIEPILQPPPTPAMQAYTERVQAEAQNVQKQQEVAVARQLATGVEEVSRVTAQPIGYKPSVNIW